MLHTGFMSRFSLAPDEVDYLAGFVKKGRKSARELTRVRILLMLHDGMTEMDIKGTLGICRATVSNIKRRYREEGLQCALSEKPRSGQPRKYTDAQEAEIIALACKSPPKGRVRWTRRSKTHTPENSIPLHASPRKLAQRRRNRNRRHGYRMHTKTNTGQRNATPRNNSLGKAEKQTAKENRLALHKTESRAKTIPILCLRITWSRH